MFLACSYRRREYRGWGGVGTVYPAESWAPRGRAHESRSNTSGIGLDRPLCIREPPPTGGTGRVLSPALDIRPQKNEVANKKSHNSFQMIRPWRYFKVIRLFQI